MDSGRARNARPARASRALVAGMLMAPLLAIVQPAPAIGAEGPWIDTTDRAEVLSAYLTEFDRVEPDSGWTGDAGSCDAGTTSQAYRDSMVQRVNWYRRMAGLAPVTERADYTAATQATATMMSAEGHLTHSPDSGYACHTEAGATAAGRSNLALGVNGIAAIDAYVRDPGSNNHSVGHRRTILYPQLLEVGTGDVDANAGHHAANSLHVFDDNLWGSRPAVREARGFIAWPPSGYVPPATVWGRWSFSLEAADFGTAAVTVADDLGPVAVTVLDRISPPSPGVRIAPEPSIVWAIGADTNSSLLPTPSDGDECYAITVSGVRIGGAVQPDYSYSTCVIDPDVESSGTVEPPSDPLPPGVCAGVTFSAWTSPCWADPSSLDSFGDVNAAWQREPVAWLVANDITTGVATGVFDPDAAVTRAQAATFIWRLAGSPPPPSDAPTFTDVPANAWYADAVRWMARHGITTGTGGGRFSPHAGATRAEFVTFLWRLVDEPTVNAAMPFSDLSASWQHGAVRWAATSEVTTGTTPTTFAPDAAVTRGQAAALLARFAAALG